MCIRDRLPLYYAIKNKASYSVICTLRENSEKYYNGFQLGLLSILAGRFDEYDKISKDGITINDTTTTTINDTTINDNNSSNSNSTTITIRYVSSYQLRVFVSSTFTDTHIERNIILDEVVPILKDIAAPYNIGIVFIDMRYGVRDENTADHMTWIACKKELDQCRELSNGIFFLSLQGDKYGYQPIPKYITQDVYNTRYSLLSLDDQSLLNQWYQLDTNNIPSRYICLLYTSPSPRDRTRSRMPSSA